MDLLVIAFVFAIGIAVGYMIFYFRYEQREIVDEMRNRLESNAHDIQAMKMDLMEYIEQNKILKEKANDLLVKNDDLSKIVAEMSRYYQYLKNAYEKAKDLADFLKVFEESDHKAKYHTSPKMLMPTSPSSGHTHISSVAHVTPVAPSQATDSADQTMQSPIHSKKIF